MVQDKSKRIVNRHFIGVLREVNDYLKYEEVDIHQEDCLIEEIEVMKENENFTLMDVQQRFVNAFPPNSVEDYYNYIYPYEYSVSYVNLAEYPEILTYDKYKNKLNEKATNLRNEVLLSDETKNSLEFIRKHSESNYQKKIIELENGIAQEVEEYKNVLRMNFNYKRFIYAHNYNIKLEEIIHIDDVRMYSTDQIGWKEFEYNVNEDITIHINTNFGYGSASYFFCNLKFKDINILPYSWVVNYYYVEMMDFVRYTRRYIPERISWKKVFEFTVKTSNMAKHKPEKFIKEWIVNEVEKMMKGMRQCMSTPDKKLADFLNVKKRSKLLEQDEVVEYALKDIIRNCNDGDKEEYRALPKEKVIAFKAEKITGGLLLLDNLRKLTEIAKVIVPYILEIEEMNFKLQPELNMHMKDISIDIEHLKIELNKIIRMLVPLKTLFDIHKKKIECMLKESNENKEYKDKISEWKAEKIYGEKYPEYVKLKTEIEIMINTKEKLVNDIYRRKKFYKILKKCNKRIVKYLKVV